MNSPFIKGSSWSSTSGRGNSNFCLTRSSACAYRHVRSTLSSLAQIISFSPLHFGWVPSRPSCATRCRSGSLWQGKQQPCLRKRKLRLDTTHHNKSLFCKRQSYLPSVVLPRPAWQEKAHCVAAGSFFLFSYLSFLMFIIHMQVPFVIFITFYIYHSSAGS